MPTLTVCKGQCIYGTISHCQCQTWLVKVWFCLKKESVKKERKTERKKERKKDRKKERKKERKTFHSGNTILCLV